MRIIAGSLKGRVIETNPTEEKGYRPTLSRTREALFGILTSGYYLNEEDGTHCLDGATILDLCAGSGALGFEALSRGAKQVVFIDQNPTQLKYIEKNARHFGVIDRCYFIRADMTTLPKARLMVDVMFVDPPYQLQLVPRALSQAHQQGWLKKNAVIVAETGDGEIVAYDEAHYDLVNQRRYGKANLWFFDYLATGC
jgi:16S rRNA (guanine966-N2)-methyltransferase